MGSVPLPKTKGLVHSAYQMHSHGQGPDRVTARVLDRFEISFAELEK